MAIENASPLGGGGGLRRLLSVLFLSWVLLLGAGVALAQDAEEEAEAEETASAEPEREADDAVEEIIVTGSRIRRDAFTAALPVTVITADRSTLAGLTDAGEILQSSALASGSQIDNTYGGLVVSGGPGVNTFGLRSLSADRTLVLVNGRRFTPAGVRGEINNVDLNTIPSIAIQRIEILKDGASSVYGADAVAGVVSIITRKQFDELSVNFSGNEGQESYDASLAYGKTFDRGYFDFAAQFSRQSPIKRNKFRWSECDERPRADGGRASSIYDGSAPKSPPTLLYPANRLPGKPASIPARPGRCFGSIYGTVIARDWYGYSENEPDRLLEVRNALDVMSFDEDKDGVADVDNRALGDPLPFAAFDSAYRDNQNWGTEDLIPGERLLQVYSDGAWDFDLDRWGTVEASFEFYYTHRRNIRSGSYRQFFPRVSSRNPTGAALAAALGYTRPTALMGPLELAFDDDGNPIFEVDQDGNMVQARVRLPTQARDDNGDLLFELDADGNQELDEDGNPIPVVATRPGDPLPSLQPLLLAYDFLNPVSNVEVDTLAFRGGLGGDVGAFNWQLDLSYSFSRGEWNYETFVRDRVARALSSEIGTDGELQCTLDPDQLLIALDSNREYYNRLLDADGNLIEDPDCVPIDLFSRDALVDGRLSPEAADYIVDRVYNESDYDLLTANFNTEGVLFDLPAGEMRGAFGLEWRRRELDDRPPQVAADDNQWGFASAGRTMGDDEVREAYAEIDFPLLAGFAVGNMSVAEELTFNTAYRFTDYSSYGSDSTYRFLLNWGVNPTVRVRTSFGTSFRAPALYELNLQRQTGFQPGRTDPCEGLEADDVGTTTAANCEALGLGIDSDFAPSSLRVISGGNLDLAAETSESLTAGLILTPNLKDWLPSLGVNVSLAVDYYDIELENSISALTADFILSQCYSSPGFTAQECGLIDDFDPATGGRTNTELNDIISSFVNIAAERSTGYDITVRADREFSFGDLEIDLLLARLLSYQTQLTPLSDVDEFSGHHAYADWRGELDVRLDFGALEFLWRIRYIDATDEDPISVGSSSTGSGGVPNTTKADEVFYHTFSLSYEDPQERFEVILGINNVSDRDPPVVGWGPFDPSDATNVEYNIPIGGGYDIFHRRLYATFQYNF